MWQSMRWGILALMVAMAACAGGAGDMGDATGTDGKASTTGNDATTPEGKAANASVAGDWRVISQVIYFKNGLTSKDVKVVPITTLLKLTDDGKWAFGSSSGTWSANTIEDKDWTEWDVKPYGPTTKGVINNWANGTATGPVEVYDGKVEFVWVIYPYMSDTNGPGTVWLKFGRN